MLAEGKPPATQGSDPRKLEAQLAELRKSCETIANMCLGTIVATVLKGGTANADNTAHIATTLGVIGAAFGIIGATIWRVDDIDRIEQVRRLQRFVCIRNTARFVALSCLAAGLALLLRSVWVQHS